MPKIKVDHVISFSSEDPVHVANNVLSSDPAKKWKCKESGERSATVVLQLEKACVISGIDIGNENSAYIEVLATRSETSDDFKVLLVMSSFMTPLEARQTTNINKVRMFPQDQLSKPENEQKWDRVKIVCTQPFNRHVQYGLSFITFHTPGDKVNGTPAQTTIGRFTLRPDSPDNLSTGSLFARRTELQKETKEPLSAAAAIREAVSSPVYKRKLVINSTPKRNSVDDDDEGAKPLRRNRNELLYSRDEEEPNEKIDKIIEKKLTESKEKKAKDDMINLKKNASARPKNMGESSKRKSEADTSGSPKKKPKIVENRKKPFSELLKGVTLVMSGIQNPDRGNLRGMALAMGAKYKPDWDDSCTHLICAFANTPKFNQVKGKGKIVKKNWVEECHSQRKRLPWRRFCLDKSDSKKPESEDEIWEELKEEDKEDVSTDEEGYDDSKMQKRIEEIQAKQKDKEKITNNAFSQDTDEEVLSTHSNEVPKNLPEFLDYKTFFIDETLDEEVSKTLERYIIAYKGILAENPSEDVDFFITSEVNAENLRSYNSNALCLRPDWLWDCHNCQTLVSTADYVL